MTTINKNSAPSTSEIQMFLSAINFKLPIGFLDFFKDTDGAEIIGESEYCDLWRLTDMIQLNKDYEVDEYANGFFIFGSDGGDTAYCIEKSTGFIFDMPFIGMATEEATFKFENFNELLESV